MAKCTSAIEVTFNDNDGGVGYRLNPEGVKDFHRYREIFGKYRARWIMVKWFWKALLRAEEMKVGCYTCNKLWVLKAPIPE